MRRSVAVSPLDRWPPGPPAVMWRSCVPGRVFSSCSQSYLCSLSFPSLLSLSVTVVRAPSSSPVPGGPVHCLVLLPPHLLTHTSAFLSKPSPWVPGPDYFQRVSSRDVGVSRAL